MKKLLLFLVLGAFSIFGLSSFQSLSKKTVQSNNDPVLIVVNVDGYYGELYFDDATDQFLSGSVSKEIPNGGGAYRMYTINSVSGSLSRSLINNQVTHFDGDIYGTSGTSFAVTLTLNSSNNAALTAQ
ncbi:hypothetical protein EZ456_08835 [Pedobacter psychrodurus]|uniref:Secreted protein n=1 Tax=Pedobacter psychrodurus TaxID=2530456 RepID=A0A4R0Q069_9SPHI|nr:hypothetical protein [Pedobacter psychrodurus]TCD27296.1 hypothetical protein EZ456_08835 [Pedobacter psychrodurus]